jgi:hypothetical protein
MSQPLNGLGRFAEPSLYILVSLSEGPKHGYLIMTDVEAVSRGRHLHRSARQPTGRSASLVSVPGSC